MTDQIETSATIRTTSGTFTGALVSTSRQLSEDEIHGYRQNLFTTEVLEALKAQHAVRLLAIKNHYNLVTIEQAKDLTGAYDFSVGAKHYYTFKLSDIVDLTETLFNETRLVHLEGEFEFTTW